jgi:hypothetical protein
MPGTKDLLATIRATYDEGLYLTNRVDEHLVSLPRNDDGFVRDDLPNQILESCEALRDRISRWFNITAANIVPHTAYDHRYVTGLMHTVTAAVASRKFFAEYRRGSATEPTAAEMSLEFNFERPIQIDMARAIAKYAMNEALRIVRTAASALDASTEPAHETRERQIAFILMWMDKSRPELVDVHEAVKEVFGEFDVDAYRADEVEHQDRITDLVLEKIKNADFLFADLTGERPNVYYEVGYAHALGKRPILYRRTGTALHFDLSVHNVPEYTNISELRKLLRDRVRAIRAESTLSIRRAHNAQSDLLDWARERLRAVTMQSAPELVGRIDFSSLVLSSDGFYEMMVQDREVFRRLRKLIVSIARQADVGWGVTLRCPSLEEKIRSRQMRRKVHSA